MDFISQNSYPIPLFHETNRASKYFYDYKLVVNIKICQKKDKKIKTVTNRV